MCQPTVGKEKVVFSMLSRIWKADETMESHFHLELAPLLFFCTRALSELPFLLQCFPSLKKVQLPSLSKLPFKSIDQKFMEKSKNQLNNFLQVRKQTTE